MKKICALVLLLGSLAVLPGCIDDECKVDRRPYFDIHSFSAENVLRTDTSMAQYLGNYYWLGDSIQPITANLFGIELRADISFYSDARSGISSSGQAYACTPSNPGHKGSQERISTIKITSNAAFDTAHAAGADLKEFFYVSAKGQFSYWHNDTLTTLAIPLTKYLNSEPRARQQLQLWLTQRPETALSHRFTVVYKQTNGEEYVVTAPLVTFQ